MNWLTTRRPFPAWQGPLRAMGLIGAVNAYFASNTQSPSIGLYTLVNLRAGVINGPWDVMAFARNLTDKLQLSFK